MTIAPRLGGEFRLVLEAPHYLDPASVESVYDALPVGQIFDGLVALDPGLHIVPALSIPDDLEGRRPTPSTCATAFSSTTGRRSRRTTSCSA